MRTKRDYANYQAIKVEPEITVCPRCGQRLRCRWWSDRRVAFLDRRQEILYQVRRCTNPKCDGRSAVYPPEVLQTGGVLPKHEFGLDVIALIGTRRLTHHETFAQIGQTLRSAHGVPIQDRWVEELFTVYLALITANIAEDPQRLARLRAQGRIILALDAAQPEGNGESLWIFRDTLSGEILLGFCTLGLDAEGLATRLREIRKLGIPITGVISDAQNIIVEAVAKALPGVPHQLCQIHFLRDFAKPVTEADRALSEDLSKQLRGLSAFEKAAAQKGSPGSPTREIKAPKSVTLSEEPPRPSGCGGRPRTQVRLKPPGTPEEAAVVRTICELLRGVLKHQGRYPLQSPGLETRQRLQQLLGELDGGLKKKETVYCF